MFKILVCGDSIAYGKRDAQWWRVARLRKRVDHTYNLGETCQNAQVYNLSIPGETALRMQKRFRAEVEARVVHPDPGLKISVIFALGINDSCAAPWIQGQQTPIDEFAQAMETMITHSRDAGHEVMVLWLTPIDETKIVSKWSNQQIGLYDTVLVEVAKKYSVRYIPLFELFQSAWLVTKMSDGLHPDEHGHQKIFEIVKESLQSL
jgi:lysophospholipase L1-like esterase